MSDAPFPPPPPQPGGPTTDMDADFPNLGFRLRFRASWEFFDAAQQVMGAWTQLGRPPQPGGNIAVGFNVFFAHQTEPGTFTITAPSYRADALTEQTDDLSEALWIHTTQLQLAELTRTAPLASRLDHLLDISAGARAALSDAAASFSLLRRQAPHTRPTGATHTGWSITLVNEPASAVEQISGAELAHHAPTLVAPLALPQSCAVLVEAGRVRSVTQVQPPAPGSGGEPPVRTLFTWDPPAPARETVSLTAHGIEFFTEVDPEYKAEALQILGVVNQRSAETWVDNYAINFGFIFLVFRTAGEGRMRVKTTDVSVPGDATTTPDLTWAAALRRRQLAMREQLGRPAWTDLSGPRTTFRVHPGALDGPQVVMRREQPTGTESGWVIGTGPGQPDPMPAHEVHFRLPQTATYFPLPPGFEVTLRNGQLERVVDGAGAVVWPRA